jgi:hypothetical protein
MIVYMFMKKIIYKGLPFVDPNGGIDHLLNVCFSKQALDFLF